MGAPTLTDLQKAILVKVAKADLKGDKYRAEGSGERVTLASLYYKHILDRQPWRGENWGRSTAYEYFLHPVVREEFKKLIATLGSG